MPIARGSLSAAVITVQRYKITKIPVAITLSSLLSLEILSMLFLLSLLMIIKYTSSTADSVQNIAKNARVSENAYVCGFACVSGDAEIYGKAQVYGVAHVYGSAHVHGFAIVHGNAKVHGNVHIGENIIVDGSVDISTDSDLAKLLGQSAPTQNSGELNLDNAATLLSITSDDRFVTYITELVSNAALYMPTCINELDDEAFKEAVNTALKALLS